MSFNAQLCVIRKIYCGNAPKPPKGTASQKYSRKGTPYECLKRGYGIADWEHRKRGLSKTSLQQIPYIGEAYEANFRKQRIYSIKTLLKATKGATADAKRAIIRKGCTRSSGSVDQKAFNSVVLFLHNRGQKDLPKCKTVKE